MTDLTTFLPTILASAFGGGLVAGGFGIHNRIATKNDEHEKWLREQKTEAYAGFLGVAHSFMLAAAGIRTEQLDLNTELLKLRDLDWGDLELLAPAAVRVVAKELEGVITDIFEKSAYEKVFEDEEALKAAEKVYFQARDSFIAVAQEDLGIAADEHPMSGSALALR